MRSRKTPVILLFVCLFAGLSFAQTGPGLLHISGIGEGPDGAFFAIVRGHGVVRKGDIVPVATTEVTGKVRILLITRYGVEIQRLGMKISTVTVREPDKLDGLRDPFLPVKKDAKDE
jgi:hypothetical protein